MKKRMNILYLAAILAVVSAGFGVIAVGAADNGPSANGQGFFTDFNGGLRTFSFNAVTKSDGTVTGHATLHNRDGDFFYNMEVNCLRVTGNVATVSGIIKKTNNPIAEEKTAYFKVIDNGEGSSSEPDGVSRLAIYIEPEDGVANCQENLNLGIRAIEGGNIQVKP